MSVREDMPEIDEEWPETAKMAQGLFDQDEEQSWEALPEERPRQENPHLSRIRELEAKQEEHRQRRRPEYRERHRTGDYDERNRERTSNGHGSQLPNDNRGRVTSVLGVILVALIVIVVVIPAVLPTADEAERVLRAFGMSGIALVLMVPAVLLGLRSACTPKGHVGRGRGIVTVVAGTVVPVISVVITVLMALGLAHEVVNSGIASRIVNPKDGSVTIVTPLGKTSVTKETAKVLDSLGLLPELTMNENGSIPISASDGVIYLGGQQLDANTISGLIGNDMTPEITADTIKNLADGITEAKENGWSLSLNSSGQPMVEDKYGNTGTLSLEEDGKVHFRTDTTVDASDALRAGADALGASS